MCDALRDQVRRVLLEDWDPADAARSEHSHTAYDAYIDPLIQLLQGGADEDAIVNFLRERERESMCFPGLDARRLHRPARKLIALRDRSAPSLRSGDSNAGV